MPHVTEDVWTSVHGQQCTGTGRKQRRFAQTHGRVRTPPRHRALHVYLSRYYLRYHCVRHEFTARRARGRAGRGGGRRAAAFGVVH